ASPTPADDPPGPKRAERPHVRSRGVPVLRDVAPESPPAEPVMVAVPRPVDEKRLALDLVALDEPPVAAVLGVVAVVAHDEVGIGRHGRRLAAVGVAAVAILDRARAVGEFRVRLDE